MALLPFGLDELEQRRRLRPRQLGLRALMETERATPPDILGSELSRPPELEQPAPLAPEAIRRAPSFQIATPLLPPVGADVRRDAIPAPRLQGLSTTERNQALKAFFRPDQASQPEPSEGPSQAEQDIATARFGLSSARLASQLGGLPAVPGAGLASGGLQIAQEALSDQPSPLKVAAGTITAAKDVTNLARLAGGAAGSALPVISSAGGALGPATFGAQAAAEGGAQGLRSLVFRSPSTLASTAGRALSGLGSAAGLGLGIQQALAADTPLGQASGATGALGSGLGLASLAFPPLAPFAAAAGALSFLLGLGNLFGKQGVYDPKREAAAEAAAQGTAAIQRSLAQGVSDGTQEALYRGFTGAGAGDPFNIGRIPSGLSLWIPNEVADAAGLPPDPDQWPPGVRGYEFLRSRGNPQNSLYVDRALFDWYLDQVRKNPEEALSWIHGSADVGYLPQAQAEAAAAANAEAGREAIRRFLANEPTGSRLSDLFRTG